MERIRY